jgi:hypothetical protein
VYEILCTGQKLKTQQWCDALMLCTTNLTWAESKLQFNNNNKNMYLQVQAPQNSDSTMM